MNKDSVIAHMRELQRAEQFEVLVGLWATEREALIAEGKKSRREGLWEELAGYDRATNVIFQWAGKKLSNESPDTPNPFEE